MFNRWSPGFRADQIRSRKRLEEEGLHEELEERFRKTLYYGELPDDDDCPSLPLTGVAVNFFQGATPRGLGQIDLSIASSLADNACVSPGSLVTSMIYAKRLRHRNPEYLRKMSSSDLFFISVMMASKYMYDEGVEEEVFNDEWAEANSMELDEVNQMERDFLSAMDWQLFVSQSEFLRAVTDLEKRIAWTQGCDRGWLSYTDMDILWDKLAINRLWDDIAREWLKVVAVSSAAYVAGFLTMVGSTALALQLSPVMTGCLMSQPRYDQPIDSKPHIELPIGSELDIGLPIRAESHFEQPTSVLLNDHFINDTEKPQGNKHEMSGDRLALPLNQIVEDTKTIKAFSNTSIPDAANSNNLSPPNLLEKVLPQLWAVVAFKDRFVQLLCAFSEGLNHMKSDESLRQIPKKCTSCRATTSSENSDQSSSQRSHPCKECPQCKASDTPKQLKSCPLIKPLDDDNDASATNLLRLKLNLNFDPWCCPGNRPPDAGELHIGMLRYPDITRGFTTSVPVAA